MRGKTLAVNLAGKEMAAVMRTLNAAWYRVPYLKSLNLLLEESGEISYLCENKINR